MRQHCGLFPFNQSFESLMKIELTQPFAANGKVDEFDVKQMKKALNRLGYYQPYEKVGITGIADMDVFNALKAFQKDYGLSATGTAKPNDETVRAINKQASKTPEGQYVWRTVEDEKVRNSHAEFNRTVRDWNDDPDPGEEFNCRCWASSVDEAIGLFQEVISSIDDSKDKWNWTDFVDHYYKGKSKIISLSDAGLLSDVVDHAREIIFERVEKQIEEKAKSIGNASLSDTFSRSYDFGSVSFSLGNSTVSGNIKGTVKKIDKILAVEAKVEYLFFDQFTDPLSIRENRKNGTSSSDKADPYTEVGGTAYDIVGRWLTKVTGTIDAAK
jgi:hypothetical protein